MNSGYLPKYQSLHHFTRWCNSRFSNSSNKYIFSGIIISASECSVLHFSIFRPHYPVYSFHVVVILIDWTLRRYCNEVVPFPHLNSTFNYWNSYARSVSLPRSWFLTSIYSQSQIAFVLLFKRFFVVCRFKICFRGDGKIDRVLLKAMALDHRWIYTCYTFCTGYTDYTILEYDDYAE